MLKTCTKCGIEKDTSCFRKRAASKDGLSYQCSACRNILQLEYSKRTKAKRTDTYNKYKEKNRNKISQYQKKWYEKNKDRRKKLREENKESLRVKRAAKRVIQIKIDVPYRLRHRLRGRFFKALRGNYKNGSAVYDLGCSIDFLKEHLESQFTAGMTWDNWGFGEDKWNIDHIMPMNAFNLEDRQHVLLACHYGNLQPLWTVDNLKKARTIPDMEKYYVAA